MPCGIYTALVSLIFGTAIPTYTFNENVFTLVLICPLDLATINIDDLTESPLHSIHSKLQLFADDALI